MFTGDKMNLNGFSLGITAVHGDSEKVKIEGVDYFSLAHGSEYSLSLSNNRSERCDAHVVIDGDKVGVWRINPYSSINIERPVDVKRKFIFLAEDSAEADDAGIPRGRSQNGLVKVTFKPEKTYYRDFSNCRCSKNHDYLQATSFGMSNTKGANITLGMNNSYANESFSAGATGLGDRSFQNFSTTGKLTHIDHSNITTIQTRLVVPNYHSSPRVIRLRDGLKKTPYPKRVETPYPKRVDKKYPCWWHLPYIYSNDRDEITGTWF